MGILETIKKSTGAKKAAPAKEPKAKKAEASEPVISQSGETRETKEAYRLLIKPLVTEKTTELAHHGKYVFKVLASANKITVAKAVAALYEVKVSDVNIINQRGKAVTFGGRKGRRSASKKAIVTLAKGQKITLFEGV